MLIALDSGHGGLDQGASGNGLIEKAVTWKLANMVKTVLADYDAEIVIVQPSCDNPNSTGNDELYLPPKTANKMKADFYLSLHVNAGGGKGFESYVHPMSANKEADRVRGFIHYQVMQYLSGKGIADRGKKYANFAVLRLTNMPAVLLESLFIDNSTDAGYLKDPLFLWGLAVAIAKGMVMAFNLNVKG